MAIHNIRGKTGEQLAAEYLITQGYDIRDMNWRDGKLEIDIVATDKTTLVIVEVKTRSTDKYGFPEEAINEKKIRHLVHAADAYLKYTDIPFETTRFDVITITGEGDDRLLEHVQDAFYPPLEK
ncbi:YraN family protein [Coprobacter tertius]|uniref:UPF0102 protein NMU02_11640 n=1 Tax=Coprobacter tertius TaxID=2944915 RepID=A0ABT1ML15_9BACT|nr:YraN family protein [Coprobacter tertius]MCP9612744.1 YraN family protein [Coprobacter tertius]